jgi:hypothetical protein
VSKNIWPDVELSIISLQPFWMETEMLVVMLFSRWLQANYRQFYIWPDIFTNSKFLHIIRLLIPVGFEGILYNTFTLYILEKTFSSV